MAIANPYVGPKPFTSGQPLFGRNREIAELRYLLTAERVVLLYSPSGAGKSSLVQAGLIPAMEKRFDVWGPTRVNTQPPAGVSNRYIWSAIAGLEKSEQRPDMTLTEYAAARPHTRNPLIVFDQFEEILRVEPEARETRWECFRQLGELLHDPHIWALFILREDYLAPLEPYMEAIPSCLQHRYRLDRLTTEMAARAIEGPTETLQRKYAAGVIDRLVTNLATVQVQGADGKPQTRVGEYVEPLQLQVVCFDLWERLERENPSKLVIEERDIGDVSRTLRSYYDRAVGSTLAAGDVADDERAIREWFQNELITADGLRNEVRHEEGRSGGLGNTTIRRLLDSYIVRAEPRGGSTWYELAHDRLIEPVRASNREWLDAHLNWLQKLVAVWVLQQRPAGRLLLGGELEEAERIAGQQKALTADEQEFLARSREAEAAAEQARAAAERERRLSVRNRRLGIAASLLALVAIVASVLTLLAARRAESALIEAETARQAAQKSLDDVVAALQAQVSGNDVTLVRSGLDQLIRLRRPEEIVTHINGKQVRDNQWLASMVSALELLDANGADRSSTSSIRTVLRARVISERGIAAPPAPEEDDKMNRRVAIAAGSFAMGGKEPDGRRNEWPQHQVSVSAFHIQQHEVTNREYWRFAAKPEPKAGELPVADDEPVVKVSWYDAVAYAFWLGGQLPTEAQWEFAARGPQSRIYPWGNAPAPTCAHANLNLGAGCRAGAQKVMIGRDAGKTPEEVYDLIGNVWEWCRDAFAPYAENGAAERDPVGPMRGEGRVVRGNSFNDPGSVARASYRLNLAEEESNGSIGFRVIF